MFLFCFQVIFFALLYFSVPSLAVASRWLLSVNYDTQPEKQVAWLHSNNGQGLGQIRKNFGHLPKNIGLFATSMVLAL